MNHALPGEDWIEAGLKDLRADHETVAALLVAIGSPRLRIIQTMFKSFLEKPQQTETKRSLSG